MNLVIFIGIPFLIQLTFILLSPPHSQGQRRSYWVPRSQNAQESSPTSNKSSLLTMLTQVGSGFGPFLIYWNVMAGLTMVVTQVVCHISCPIITVTFLKAAFSQKWIERNLSSYWSIVGLLPCQPTSWQPMIKCIYSGFMGPLFTFRSLEKEVWTRCLPQWEFWLLKVKAGSATTRL